MWKQNLIPYIIFQRIIYNIIKYNKLKKNTWEND